MRRDNSLSQIYNGLDLRKSALDGEENRRQIANYVFNHHFRENEERGILITYFNPIFFYKIKCSRNPLIVLECILFYKIPSKLKI